MAEAKFTFPESFMWGCATAAHQVEGGNKNNNWYAWEQAGKVMDGHSAGKACDWWSGRWREDFDRAKEAGQNAHRFSVEWSRIQPAPDRWDEAALDRYREMAKGLRARGLVPMVTLHHFTDPLWIYENGGWEIDRSEIFTTYVRKVVEALREYVNIWVTFNEPNVCLTLGYVIADFPPGKKNLFLVGTAMKYMVKAHAAAYHAIHEIQPEARVGVAHHYRSLVPARSWHPLDRLITRYQSRSFNEAFPMALKTGWLKKPIGWSQIPEAKGTQDYFGINYYTREQVKFSLFAVKDVFGRRYFRENTLLSPTGFIANEPEGLFDCLRWAAKFGFPIFITENGVEDVEDTLRPRYLVEHLRQIWLAINFNFDIQGYFHWTLVDNFEWERGWSQRFGLWELDIETQARKRRQSADLYEEICRANALSSEMVEKYAPDIYPEMFPG